MEVTFTLTVDDWVAWIMYGEETSRSSGWLRFWHHVNPWLTSIHLAGFVVALLVPLLGLLINRLQLSTYFLYVPLVLLLVIGYHRVFGKSYEDQRKRYLRRQFRKNFDSQVGEQRLTLTEQELIHATHLRTTAIPWSAVEKIVTTKDHAFFIRGNLVYPYVLPKRAFPQEADFTAFVEAARSCREAAGRDGAAVRPPEEAGVSRRPGGELEVVYRLAREDVAAQTNHSLIHDKTWRRMRWMAAAAPLPGVILLIVVFYLTDPQMVFLVGLPLMILAGVLLFMPLGIFVIMPRTIHQQFLAQQAEAPHRLRLAADSLIHAADDAVTATPWAAVEKIVTTTDHAFFHTDGGEIVVLPRRAFGRESEYTEFVETANQRRESAK